MKTKKRKMKITNKRRFTMFVLTMLILTCCGFTSIKNNVKANEKEYIYVVVSSGDTLWDIASQNNPENKDVRKIVQNIKKHNDLKSNVIYSGDTLKIPTDC